MASRQLLASRVNLLLLACVHYIDCTCIYPTSTVNIAVNCEAQLTRNLDHRFALEIDNWQTRVF